MNAAIRLLLVPYRDLLIDELQVLQTRRNMSFPDPIQTLMAAAMRDRAREKQPLKGFRGFLKTLGIAWEPDVWQRRCDDSVEPCDLFLLEATLIQHLDNASELTLRLVTLRELLGSLLTSDSYAEVQRHLLALPPMDRRVVAGSTSIAEPAAANSIDSLRAEAIALSSRLYRRIGGLPAVEELRTGVAGAVCGCALFVLAISACLTFLHLTPYGTLEMACWGAVGAMVSTIERLYRVDPMHEPLKTALTLSAGWFPLMLTPLIGSIFALVLYLLLRGDFISGALFPKVRCADPASRLWLDAFAPAACSSLEQYVELGKLLVWGFLAGWAERMVPDVLDKLAPQPSGGLKTAGKPH